MENLTHPMPPKPRYNDPVHAAHPWARYWIAEALRLNAINGPACIARHKAMVATSDNGPK